MRYVLSALFVVSTWMDFFTTYVLLSRHEAAYEANWVAAWVLYHHGWWGLVAQVATCDVVVLGLLHYAWRKGAKTADAGFAVATLVSNGVVIHNLALLAYLSQ